MRRFILCYRYFRYRWKEFDAGIDESALVGWYEGMVSLDCLEVQ